MSDETQTMTPEDIDARVVAVTETAANGHPRLARIMERQLHLDVLHALSMGLCEDRKLCAFLAGRTREIQSLEESWDVGSVIGMPSEAPPLSWGRDVSTGARGSGITPEKEAT